MTSKEDAQINQNLKLFAKTSVFVFIFVLLSKILTYIYRIIIARHYGPEVYGTFALSIVVLSLFATFARIGIPEGLYRFIPIYRGKNKKNEIQFLFRKSILIVLINGIVLSIVLFFLSEFIAISLFSNESLIFFLKIFSLLLPLYVLFDTLLVILLSYEKIITHSFIFNILQNISRVALIVILILLGLNSISIPISYAFGTLIGITFIVVVLWVTLKSLFHKPNLSKSNKSKVFNEFFKYSWPLLFSSLFLLIFSWVDTLLIGFFLDAESVGFYNSAVPIAFLLSLAPNLFIQLFFPIVTKEYSKNNLEVIKQLSKQLGKWIFMINFPFFVLIFLFPGVFINFFFGGEYLLAESSLRFLAIGMFFNSIFIISQNLISMIGKSKLILFDICLTVIINIILNIILIPKYGITGASVATMGSYLLLNFLFVIQANHFISIIPLRRKIISIFFISIIPTALLIFLRSQLEINTFSLILIGIFFFLIYILLIFLTKSFDRNDLTILRSVKEKLFG